MSALAARLGCAVLVCTAAQEALALLQGQEAIGALVVTHDPDGGDVCRLIENLRLLPHRVALPVAFVMAERDPALAQRALLAGATEVFLAAETEYLGVCLADWLAEDEFPSVDGCVLLVEDSESEAALIAHLLKVMGLTVQCAARVDTACQLLAEHDFQLAVIDFVLDDSKTGIALLQHLRRDFGPALPVLMMSGHNDPSRRLAAIRSGADDFLAKPFVIEEFVWRVARLLRGSAAADEEQAPAPAANGAGNGRNGWSKLSARETQIARCLLDGLSDKKIAAQLGISYWTVRSHVQHVFDKLGVINRRELMLRYLRTGR